MRQILSAAALAAFAFCAAAQPTPPAAVDPRETQADRWNLADLYADEAAWKADAAKLAEQLKAFAGCKGQLGRSAARLRECLDARADAYRRIGRLYVYASQQSAGDTGSPAFQSLAQRADLLYAQVQEATAFVDPELLHVGRKRLDGFLKADPKLRIYAYPIAVTLRSAAHTLSDAGEAIVAQYGSMTGAAGNTYQTLSNADMPWPKVKLSTGEEVEIDASAYTKYREVPNRDDRKRVMDAFFGSYKQLERTFGVTLYSQMKEDSVLAKVRKYPDSISRALDGNHVPVQVMDTLIAQTEANLPTLHRYFKLRAKLLGVSQMAYYDIYPPLVHSDLKFPLARGKQLALDAAAPLGADYVAAYRKGLDSRWMDAYPRPRKMSGAHMAGYAYDVHPYVLMNYNDDYESVTTLAHEWGHAMHTVLANRAQPSVTADYPTFTAEIASTFNEALLLDHVLKTAKSDDERLLYLGLALEGLRGTFFRQAMFADFERKTHARVDAGEPMTGADYTKTYCELLKRYHGADQGVVAIDDAYCIEWAYIPHFYNSYYVYQYATSIAAASLFSQRVLAGESGALERYKGVLSAGGSKDPYELVRDAGVDLATPAPYQAIVARMNRIMDEMETLLAKKPG